MQTKIYTFGYLGWEIKVDSHIRTRVIFAIADEKKRRLAWYMFSQDMVVPAWGLQFQDAAVGKRKLDRPPEIFASAATGQPSLRVYPYKFDIGALAPRLGEFTPSTTWANLDLRDDQALGTTSCIIGIDLVVGGKSKNFILLDFEMSTEGKRSTFDIRKTGRAYLIGMERFSTQAIDRGPTPAIAYTPRTDPYLPGW